MTTGLRSAASILARRAAFSLLSLSAALLVQPCLGGPGTFQNTGSLATPREYHTATLLPSGKVLVTGGWNSGDFLASAELYDPATGTWTATASLPTAVDQHTATLLPNGQVLVAGGFNTSVSFAIAKLYDPASGTWTATGSMTRPRSAHTATLLPNGKVLVAAGSTVISDLYDPATGTWTATGSMGAARHYPTATLLPSGKVLVAGGYDDSTGGSYASAELYDPASGTWTATGDLATPRHNHAATLLPNGKVLVIGGFNFPVGGYLASAELYDPATGTWAATGSLPFTCAGPTATLLPNGQVLAAGGFNDTSGNYLANAELYHPTSGSWTTIGSLATQRVGHTATLLPNGYVLVAGGYNGSSVASAELYVSVQPTPTPTPAATPATLGNISTRLRVETGDNALIGGFIVTGAQPKRVIVRAIGPSLGTTFPDRLADPTLELRDATGALLASNDNWRSTQEAEIIATGVPPTDDSESAIVATLPANNAGYTAIVRGANNGTGIGVVEAYDLDRTVNSKLANISTRGSVQTGNNVLIAGTIVLGQAAQRVIVRALGPSLTVAGKMADPTLELRDGNGAVLASNNNWRSTQEAEIIATGIPPTNDLESAIVTTLPANNAAYTAIVRGLNDTTGIAVVEVYALN